MSKKRTSFQFRKKMRRIKYAAFSFSITLIAWEIFSRSGAINPVLLPPPTEVFRSLIEAMGPGTGYTPPYLMFKHIGYTFWRLVVGYSIAAVSCTLIGIVMGMNERFYLLLNPLIAFMLPIPNIAMVPLAILWFGLGNKTVIFIVILAASFSIIYSSAAGVRSVNKKLIWAAEMMGCSRMQILTRVLIPAALPHIVTGLKLGLGQGWRGVIAGEIFAATMCGLGFMIFDARTFLATDVMYAGIIVVGILGYTIETVAFGYLDKRTTERWGMVKST